MRLYHLLEAQYALSNIALRRIKISRFADLNDPFELMGVDLKTEALKVKFKKAKQELHKNRGLICFSESWENPVLWSHYADKHRGICLGFDVVDNISKPVNYTRRPLVVFNKGKTGKDTLSEEFLHRLSVTKFSDWKYEEEHRVFLDLNRKSSESGNYFENFSEKINLKQVILGPRCEIPIGQVRALVQSIFDDVEVIKARIAFRTFRVIKSVSQSK